MSLRGNRVSLGAPLCFVCCLALMAYLSYHFYHGEFGVYARQNLQSKISRLNFDLSHLSEKRSVLDRNVVLMHPGKIDPDMLDEQARRVLNLVKPDEIILVDID